MEDFQKVKPYDLVDRNSEINMTRSQIALFVGNILGLKIDYDFSMFEKYLKFWIYSTIVLREFKGISKESLLEQFGDELFNDVWNEVVMEYNGAKLND